MPSLQKRVLRTCGVLAGAGVLVFGARPAPDRAAPPDVLIYIKQTWNTLSRSVKDLAKAAVDPKFSPGPEGRWAVYVPQTDDLPQVTDYLRAHMDALDFQHITLLALPRDSSEIKQAGLLYLPKPYVVPGGRFNEMYGWDSYFIQVGLLRDGEVERAKDMADNFLYEVQHYGKVLNANRSYYLTRSQPPFLSEMVLNVYEKTHDRAWLAASLPYVIQYHDFWMHGAHLTDTGLSRYYDVGIGPAPEVLSGERDKEGRSHYDLVRAFLKTHQIEDYDVRAYYDRKTDTLTPLFYIGDRSMRESGFDPSNRFGPFNLDIIHYDPICLNTLLYSMELQIADILKILQRDEEAPRWRQMAEERAQKINQLSWSAPDGLYFDYDFETKHVRKYPFLTTFFPLWAGFASKEQAAAVRDNIARFEKPGGLETSTADSGNQWDAPFGWAPLQMIAVDGLRRYGYKDDADRLSIEFLALVRRQYLAKGYIVEKYDVVHPGAEVGTRIHFGYSTNEVGFGWTNAVYTHLWDELDPAAQKQVLSKSGAALN